MALNSHVFLLENSKTCHICMILRVTGPRKILTFVTGPFLEIIENALAVAQLLFVLFNCDSECSLSSDICNRSVKLSGVSRVWQTWHVPWAPLGRGRKKG